MYVHVPAFVLGLLIFGDRVELVNKILITYDVYYYVQCVFSESTESQHVRMLSKITPQGGMHVIYFC